MSVYQGLNPIGGLLVQNRMEQPNGEIVAITYTDDGTGIILLQSNVWFSVIFTNNFCSTYRNPLSKAKCVLSRNLLSKSNL